MYPLGRMAEISDIVDAILDQASFVTGETLPVDGGQSGAGETSPCS
jgi:NAD(P)-dependent dehydrogenase (short-subunit alcohol dehydrogenase family)